MEVKLLIGQLMLGALWQHIYIYDGSCIWSGMLMCVDQLIGYQSAPLFATNRPSPRAVNQRPGLCCIEIIGVMFAYNGFVNFAMGEKK